MKINPGFLLLRKALLEIADDKKAFPSLRKWCRGMVSMADKLNADQEAHGQENPNAATPQGEPRPQ